MGFQISVLGTAAAILGCLALLKYMVECCLEQDHWAGKVFYAVGALGWLAFTWDFTIGDYAVVNKSVYEQSVVVAPPTDNGEGE